MAMPRDVLSDPTFRADFRPPRDVEKPLLVAYERGGEGIDQVQRGLDFQNWTATCDGTTVSLLADNGATDTPYVGTNITEIDLAFDQSMRPQLALMEDGNCRLWYWDTVGGAYATLDIPGGVDPRCTLDDHRQITAAFNDVLFFYRIGNNLYMRKQRERFETEYLLSTVARALNRVGLGVNLRMQFDARTVLE